MPFPDSPRVLFRNNPLEEVICQLRFPPILAIAAEVPSAFQERVRYLYPLYEREDTAALFPKELMPIVSQLPSVGVTHKFIAEDRARFMSIAQDFIALTEFKYSRWEEFRAQTEMIEQAVREVYHPPFYSRVGLRYRNAIDKDKVGCSEATWDRLIQPHFAGLLAAGGLANNVRQSEAASVLEIGPVKGGFVLIRNGLRSPPQGGGQVYIIDADFFTQERCKTDEAFRILGEFNRLARNLFRWAITEELERALDPEPLDG